MDKKISDYIKQSKKQGFSDDEIRKSLLDAGWEEKEINEGMKKKPKSKKWLVPVIVIVGVLILGGLVFAFWSDIKGLFVGEPIVEDELVNWQTYQNEEYGFELIFPDTWKGFTVERSETNYENSFYYFTHPQRKSSDGMPGEVGFVILVYTQKEWDNWFDFSDMHKPSAINKKNGLIFAYSPGNAAAPGDLADRFNEINDIIKTFKFLDI
jgi:hypothetical protein